MQQPLVSIIIPVYNAEKYLAETIESALNQTWKNKEIIIVNDGSTDKSLEIINSFKYPEIVLINQSNQGASAAKQNGLKHSKGDYIQYLDADDILDASKIERQVVELIKQPRKIALCRTAHFFEGDNYNIDNLPEDEQFFSEYLNNPLHFLVKLYGGFDMKGGMIQPNAFLTPREIINEGGSWNINISPCTDEDGEYFCRMILKSDGIIYQSQVLNYYRKAKNKKTLSGIINNTTYSNLVESIWIKHLHMIGHAKSDYEITCIHNATYRCLEEVKVTIYFQLKQLVHHILNYQNQLYPSLKPSNYYLGGRIINFVARRLGWKTARLLSHYKHSNLFTKLIFKQ